MEFLLFLFVIWLVGAAIATGFTLATDRSIRQEVFQRPFLGCSMLFVVYLLSWPFLLAAGARTVDSDRSPGATFYRDDPDDYHLSEEDSWAINDYDPAYAPRWARDDAYNEDHRHYLDDDDA